MFTRRDFIASGLASAAAGLIVPPVLAKGVLAASNDGVQNDHVLVVLQLGGGNDGLNTLVPHGDPAYLAARPTIGMTPDKVLNIDGQFGLNPMLPGIRSLYDAGKVAVVRGVGYPTPTYSHFEALHVWEYADPARRVTDGWLGKLLATQQFDSSGHPLAACACGETSTPTEMRAVNAQISVIPSLDAYQVQGGQGRVTAVQDLYQSTPGIYGALFDRARATAEAGISALHDGTKYTPSATYSKQKTVYGSKIDLAGSMQLAAQLIVTQPTVKVIHVVEGGFDTHQQQDARQAALLSQVDSVVSAFMQDLAAHGVDKKVVLMTWSEFGRRVAENGSRGTDHGSAAPMFVIGSAVKGGMYGDQPSLTSLVDNGNLKFSTDFRSVYQTLIRDWLGGDSNAVLGASFPDVKFLAA